MMESRGLNMAVPFRMPNTGKLWRVETLAIKPGNRRRVAVRVFISVTDGRCSHEVCIHFRMNSHQRNVLALRSLTSQELDRILLEARMVMQAFLIDHGEPGRSNWEIRANLGCRLPILRRRPFLRYGLVKGLRR